MIQINSTSPRKYSDEYLRFEYDELYLLLDYVRKDSQDQFFSQNSSLEFGRMSFFNKKMMYLYSRYDELVAEMKLRNFLKESNI